MSGQPEVGSQVPLERLNQIAKARLDALGLVVSPTRDGQGLEGVLELRQGLVLHPLTRQPVLRAKFIVSGHDSLRLVEPPLSGLPPVQFYNADSQARLEERIAQSLQNRLAALGPVGEALRAWQLQPTLEPNLLLLRAVLQTPGCAYELLGAPGRLSVSRVLRAGATPELVPPTAPPLEPRQLPTRAALEQHLAALASGLSQAAPKAAAVAAPSPKVEPVAHEIGALTLSALLQKFGDAELSSTAQVELIQQFDVGGERYQFLALQEVGTVFAGRLVGPLGDEWEESFDLQLFPGVKELVASVVSKRQGRPVGAMAAAPPVDAASGPAAGQFWVMTVLVEQENAKEIRYVGLNAQGQPYGAARVLQKEWFESTFLKSSGGWTLVIRIEQVEEGQIFYRQVDQARQPRGQMRKMDLPALLSSFVIEK